MFIQRTIEIVVIEKGHTFFVPEMMQRLIHEELTAKRGKYFALVKNQLELGN